MKTNPLLIKTKFFSSFCLVYTLGTYLLFSLFFSLFFYPFCQIFGEERIEKGKSTILKNSPEKKETKISNDQETTGNNEKEDLTEEKNSIADGKDKTGIESAKKIKVTLNDGRTLSGRLRNSLPQEINIQHWSAGIEYKKKIALDEISGFEMKTWYPKKTSSNKAGEVYLFNVSSYVVILKEGKNLYCKNNFFGFFRDFVLLNENGEVHLYTFWRDLLQKNEIWYTGLSGSREKDWSIGHKDVVRSISLL